MTSTTADLVAEALFVSDLQPSQAPSAEAVEEAVVRMIRQYGSTGCAATLATEYGDHPDIAQRRMAWVRELLRATHRND